MEISPRDAIGEWSMIEAQLPANWRALAPQFGLMWDLPQPAGAKITDLAVPFRMVLHHVGTGASLKVTAATAAACKMADVSSVAVHKWMRRFGSYMAALLAEMTNAKVTFAPELWGGYDIILVDASNVCSPGGAGTAARIHYAIRLTDLHVVDVQVTDEANGGETFRRFEHHREQLWMGDRGYANPPGIASVVSDGADVVVRYNRGALPVYYRGGDRFDVLAKLNQKLRKPGVAREWAIEVRPAEGEVIKGRLCAVRLPPDKADEARARLRREQGSDVTSESLAAAEFVVVFTTIPKARMGTERVLELYCLRWQLELHIKRDKSIGDLDCMPNFMPQTVRTWICTKLLLSQVARKIASASVAIPPSADRGHASATSPVSPQRTRPSALARDGAPVASHSSRTAPSATT
jgi:Transposase DDE domain